MHFCSISFAHFCIDEESIDMIYKILGSPQLQKMNFDRMSRTYHCLLLRRHRGECIFNYLFCHKKRCLCYMVLVRFRIMRSCVNKHWQK